MVGMNPSGHGPTPPSTPLGPPRWERRAGRPRLALRAAFLTLAVAALAAAAARGASARTLDRPNALQIANGPALIPDGTLHRELSPNDFWGGTYTTSSNERVTIRISRSYPEDPAVGQQWANFVASLLHGSEI